MKNNIVIMNFSGVYEVQGLKAVLEAGKTNNHIISQLDCQDIPGTNCYCDSLAEEEIGKRIVPFGPEGLHFLDSGNYHYLTKLWLELVKEPFELLVFDHHTDMQRPAFGGILSCGGWIREALETNDNLKHVILVGPPQAAMEETKKESGFLFLNKYGELITARGIAVQLKHFGSKYGLDPSVVYPHSFRHRFAKSFLERYNDIAMLADLMGHASIETTRIYLRKTSTEQQNIINQIIDW